MAVGYIDNVALLVQASTMERAMEKVKEMMEREGGVLDWAKLHTSEFVLKKTALVGFTRRKEQKV
jgi:hypothetical protein